jgi:arginase
LLAAVPALAEVAGRAGLVFIDGHEDATTMEASTTGEAANMEVALLLGLTGQRAPEPVRRHTGVLRPGAIAMLGMRDELYRRDSGVPTIAGRVWLRTAAELHEDPARVGDRAARQVSSQAPGWWLHTDLDVLAGNEFSACGAAADPAMPGGLSWAELTAVVSSALRAGGCRGWSIGVYNPDLDPQRQSARQVVTFLAEVIGNWTEPEIT